MTFQTGHTGIRCLRLGIGLSLAAAALGGFAVALHANADSSHLGNHAVVPYVAADGSSAAASPTSAFPAPNPAYPPLAVHLEAVQVSDDNGARAADITPAQVQQWVDKANEIFAVASIRFLFDPGSDFATLNSTLLNDVVGDTDANWTTEVAAGNQVAASYPGKLVAFFRHGPDPTATGGGFSWVAYNFVAMPGFGTSVCGYQNIGAFAHEIGHYLGLSHTFAMIFNSRQDAQSYFTSHANDPEVFDGDGLADTPPDPFIDTPEFQCHTVESVTLAGHTFTLPRQNIMSYYGSAPLVDRTEVTPQQGNIARWILTARLNNAMQTPTNVGVPGATDFSQVSVKDKSRVDASVQDMSAYGDYPRWLGDRQLFCGAQLNGLIEFPMTVAAAGMYTLNLYATMAPDFGQIQTLVDGQPLGPPIDLVAPLVLPTGRVTLGPVALSAGTHTLGFRVVGKSAASSGYSFGLNEFTLTPAH